MKGPTIKLGEEGAHCEGFYNDLCKALVLESDARLKLATPVDEGRLRNAWTIGKGGPTKDLKTEEVELTGDKQSVRVVTDSSTQSYQISRTGTKFEGFSNPSQITVESDYFICNNLEYAEPVAFGTNLPRSWGGEWRSKNDQTTKGYPELIAKGMERWVKAEAGRMGDSGKY